VEHADEPMDALFPLNWSSVDAPDACYWGEREGLPVTLACVRRGLTAQVRCDPTRRERICLTRLSFWRWRRFGEPARGSERPLPPTSSELLAALAGLFEAIAAAGLTPTLVLIEPEDRFERWRQWLEREAACLGPHRSETITDMGWRLVEVLPFLDRRPFGLELAARLAARLRSNQGSLSYGHREYCGHGLRAKSGSYCLETYEDGCPAELLRTWPDERTFIDAVAGWSDYVCSGADPDAALFRAESEFYLDNQRITRARIEEYLGTPPEGRAT